jgi:hypothetical protein
MARVKAMIVPLAERIEIALEAHPSHNQGDRQLPQPARLDMDKI